jgi:sulfate transport system ATP-binding protein
LRTWTEFAGGAATELIEAQLSAREFQSLGLREGEMAVLTPRRARVFVGA